MKKNIFSKLFSRELPEGPVEAGQTLGMTPESVLERYFANRNAILSLLRIYSNLSLSDVAKELGISDTKLEEIEKSDERVPFQLVPKIAEVFNVDLKALLVLLGHAQSGDRDDKYREFSALPIAAQYSGPDLTKQEKVDLEELFKIILAEMKSREGENEI